MASEGCLSGWSSGNGRMSSQTAPNHFAAVVAQRHTASQAWTAGNSYWFTAVSLPGTPRSSDFGTAQFAAIDAVFSNDSSRVRGGAVEGKVFVHLRISSWCPEEEGGPEVVASFGCTWQPAFSTRTMQPLRFSDAMRWSKMGGLWKVRCIRKMQSMLCL